MSRSRKTVTAKQPGSRKTSARPSGGRAPKRSASGSLELYQRKRDFSRTSEPAGGATKARTATTGEPRVFVIQKHDATRLHYDLRLEMDGVLRSWAVPKGLPEKPGEKVLAVEVEDHPLDYGTFEGVIPAGNYGAGAVMLWDRGHYLTTESDPVKAHRDGHIDFALVGEKCAGNWTLIRMRRGAKDSKDNWLLIKRQEPHSRAVIKRAGRDRSVKTGRTLEEIAAGEDTGAGGSKEKSSGRRSVSSAKSKSGPRTKPGSTAMAGSNLGAERATTTTAKKPQARRRSTQPPAFVEPMKAQPVTKIPPGEWRLEVKFDGYRALAIIDHGEVELWSRNRKTWPGRFGEIREALQKLDCQDAILDGEIVALDAEGRPSFQLLQNEAGNGARPPLRYYLFDLLRLDGESYVDRPIEQRQEALADLLGKPPPGLALSPVFNDTPERLLEEAARQGLEGIIAKAPGSMYEVGRRSGAWLKCRLAREQEFVIGGYTPPQGARSHFGALLVGYYDRKELRFAGKVGTGFDGRKLRELHARFQSLRQDACPFADLPSARRPRYGQAMTAAEMKKVTWLRPTLVAQIRFAEWTNDALLRQPVFLALREDKPAKDVVREALAE
jgi:bifunctional non-homologous end joining protein LigD